jgi:hypothetical protein
MSTAIMNVRKAVFIVGKEPFLGIQNSGADTEFPAAYSMVTELGVRQKLPLPAVSMFDRVPARQKQHANNLLHR